MKRITRQIQGFLVGSFQISFLDYSPPVRNVRPAQHVRHLQLVHQLQDPQLWLYPTQQQVRKNFYLKKMKNTT